MECTGGEMQSLCRAAEKGSRGGVDSRMSVEPTARCARIAGGVGAIALSLAAARELDTLPDRR